MAYPNQFTFHGREFTIQTTPTWDRDGYYFAIGNDGNDTFRNFLADSVLDESENKIFRLVSKVNRRTKDCPLTLDMLDKSLFANFLYRLPTDDDLANVNRYLRAKEISNMICLCNIIDEEVLHKWDSTKTEQDTTQNQLRRMFSSKSIMAWSELLQDAVAAKLDILDAVFAPKNPDPGRPPPQEAGCHAHCRRYFVKAEDDEPDADVE